MYTCESESVLARFVPFSTPSFKYYQHIGIPSSKRAGLVAELEKLATEVYILRLEFQRDWFISFTLMMTML